MNNWILSDELSGNFGLSAGDDEVNIFRTEADWFSIWLLFTPYLKPPFSDANNNNQHSSEHTNIRVLTSKPRLVAGIVPDETS